MPGARASVSSLSQCETVVTAAECFKTCPKSGLATRTFRARRTSVPRSVTAGRRINEPAASTSMRGNECVRNKTFICSEIVRRVAFPREIFDARPQLAQLSTLTGDHLSKESSCEQHAPYWHAGLDEI